MSGAWSEEWEGRGACIGGGTAHTLTHNHTPTHPRAQGIVMPAHFVDDGWHAGANADPGNGKPANLFGDYAAVADSIGVYTTNDYANIVDVLVRVRVRERVCVWGGGGEGVARGGVGGWRGREGKGLERAAA